MVCRVNNLQFFLLHLSINVGLYLFVCCSFKKFWDISLICDLQQIFNENATEFTDEDVVKHIKNVAPNLEETLVIINFQGESYYFNNPFATQITSEGLCFTFNSLGRDDIFTDQIKKDVEYIGHNKRVDGWTIVNGYIDDKPTSYPKRTAEDGVAAGLDIIVFSEKFNRIYACGEPVDGFKVLIHNPAEVATPSKKYILAPINKQVVIAVKPNVITTSKGLESIPPKVRNCYFPHEKKLRFYKVYTENNCKFECFSNVTKIQCGCLPFYAPRDNNTAICGFNKRYCLQSANKAILLYENNVKKNKIDVKTQSDEIFKIFEKCSCLPSCASLNYDYQTSAAEYDIVQWFNQTDNSFMMDFSAVQATHLKIYFQDSQFLALHRSELYGQTDFLANIGGLLGLFMGFSFLSLLEIFYFLTLRIWCILYQK